MRECVQLEHLVPHLVRLAIGSDNRLVVPMSAFAGAIFVVLADLIGRETFGRLENTKYKGYVDEIHAAGEGLLTIVNNILDLTHLGSGERQVEIVPVTLEQVWEPVIREVEGPAAAKAIKLLLVPSPEPIQMAGDRG